MSVRAGNSELLSRIFLAFGIQLIGNDQIGKSRFFLPLLACASLLVLPQIAFAERVQPTVGAGVKTAATGPDWSQLTVAQQQALAPLAPTWKTGMSEPQKRKWIEISKNFGGLAPEAQATLHSRMTQWVALSPQERAQARLNFGKTNELAKQLTPEEKKAQWETYQALPAGEKQRLAATASPKPAGAATAIKPVPPQKLVAALLQASSKPAPVFSPKPALTPLNVPAPQPALPAPPASPLSQR